VKRLLDDRIEVASLTVNSGERIDVTRLAYRSTPLAAGIVKARSRAGRASRWERTCVRQPDGDAWSVATFDRLLREAPDDVPPGAVAHAVRYGRGVSRLNDRANERRSLQERTAILHSARSMFQVWYQRLG
jgi:hypothetical protein